MKSYERVIGIQGNCIMGCGEMLCIDGKGQIFCDNPDCLDPHAVAQLLHEHMSDHLVKLSQNSFHVLHPLVERLKEHSLFECKLDDYLFQFDAPPLQPGMYKVSWNKETKNWTWVNA